MGKTKYEVSRIEIDVRHVGLMYCEANEKKKKVFFEFCKVFQKYLSKYTKNTLVTFSTKEVYENNINFNCSVSINTINKIFQSIEENSKFAIKKMEYYRDSKVIVVSIVELN